MKDAAAQREEFADMLTNLREHMLGQIDDHDRLSLATMVALQEVCGELQVEIEKRTPIDSNSMRMYAGRCTLTLLGVSDTLVERMRDTLLGKNKGANMIHSNRRN